MCRKHRTVNRTCADASGQLKAGVLFGVHFRHHNAQHAMWQPYFPLFTQPFISNSLLYCGQDIQFVAIKDFLFQLLLQWSTKYEGTVTQVKSPESLHKICVALEKIRTTTIVGWIRNCASWWQLKVRATVYDTFSWKECWIHACYTRSTVPYYFTSWREEIQPNKRHYYSQRCISLFNTVHRAVAAMAWRAWVNAPTRAPSCNLSLVPDVNRYLQNTKSTAKALT